MICNPAFVLVSGWNGVLVAFLTVAFFVTVFAPLRMLSGLSAVLAYITRLVLSKLCVAVITEILFVAFLTLFPVFFSIFNMRSHPVDWMLPFHLVACITEPFIMASFAAVPIFPGVRYVR